MNFNKKSAKEKLNNYLAQGMPIIFFSLLAGLLSGIVVVLYGLVAEYIYEGSRYLYEEVYLHPAFIPLLFSALVILAFISYVILKYVPDAKGTGVPHNGTLKPILWWRTLLATIFASFISFFGGLSFGSEGPSVAVGASLGDGVSKLRRSKKEDGKFNSMMLSVGSSAGLTVALNTPISSIILAVEQLYGHLSPMLLLASSSAVITSALTAKGLRLLLGIGTLTLASNVIAIPFEFIWTAITIGLLCGISAVLFTKSLSAIRQLKILNRIPLLIKLIITFVLTGIVGLFFSDVLGSGITLIEKLNETQYVWYILLALLILKIFLMLLGVGSQASGGLLLPTLAIGALLGALSGKLFIACGVPVEYYNTFIILGIGAFFGTVLKAPLSGIVIALEASNFSFPTAVSICISVIISFIIGQLLHNNGLYHQGENNNLLHSVKLKLSSF